MLDEAPPWYYDRALRIPLYRWYHLSRVRAVCRAIPRRPNLLVDVGCDGGTMTEIVAKCSRAGTVVGIDIREESVEYARKTKRGIEFYAADARNLPLRDGVADVVTMLEVLEHVPNPVEALREAHRVLKPGGLLVVLVPNGESVLFRSVWSLWTRTFGRVWRDAHDTDFSEANLRRVVESFGFRLRSVERVNLGMLILLSAVKVISSPSKT
ncbi:MAG: class I SAM-dependent methyltransferase [Thermofilaceae archaeon]